MIEVRRSRSKERRWTVVNFDFRTSNFQLPSSITDMNAITINNLSKVYSDGTKALVDVDLEVQEGDFFALLGANGAGKTTLIGILTGLVIKTAGKAKIFQYDLDTQTHEAKKLIGVVPQEFNFNVFERVQDIIVTQAGYFGVGRKEALKESENILEKVGLTSKRNVISRSLSGGMKRRLMIARALIHKPKLLILDEPTAGVDVELRHSMWQYLRDLNREGTTILLTTHYLEEVEQMCKHAAIIKEGKIVRNEPVKNLIKIMENETFVISIREMKSLNKIKGFEYRKIDETTIEVDVDKTQTINSFITELTYSGVVFTDIRPKGFRLERLFLDLLKENS